METMYERIKRMTKEEMQNFIYWVYKNGNEDGRENCCDDYGNHTYFGGHILDKDADDVMPKVQELYTYYYEAVEVCPHCMSENIYPMWDTEVLGFVALCKYCGKEIFLCDECLHTIEQDGEPHDCDWCETECGGMCHRGETKD